MNRFLLKSNPLICLGVLILISLFCLDLRAQVSIRVELNHSNYLLYETVFARIYLRNYSGHPLLFGKSKHLMGLLHFEIDTPDGGVASLIKKGVTPPMQGTILKPGETKKILIPISAYYKMTKTGKYRISAYVEHTQLPQKYKSPIATLTVSNGITIWERLVGVPEVIRKELNPTIATRRYKIISAHDGKKKLFYLVIEDDKMIYSVKRIAYEIGNAMPKCEIDALSRLHILVRIAPKVFGYFVYDVDGKLENRAMYLPTITTPVLTRDPENGQIIISGGKKAQKGIDYENETNQPFLQN